MRLLLSDLDHNHEAGRYGNAGLLFLREAGAAEATAWYVLAKIARWRHQYVRAADLARQGLQHSTAGSMRVQLACYEANAAALAGDASRARAAMWQAEQSAAALPATQVTASPLVVPRGADDHLQALGRPALPATRTGLCGTPRPPGRAGPRTGRMSRPPGPRSGSAAPSPGCSRTTPTALVDQVKPVLKLPPELRIATVTGWLADLDHQLEAGRYLHTPIAADLRQQIRDFTTTALRADRPEESPP